MFQKIFSMFFAYIIGFQLVVGAIPHHALNNSAWAQSCTSGLQWNEMLGRCVTTAQAAELKDASRMCETKGDDAAKKQCYRDVIEGKMKDEGVAGAGKISSSTMSIMLAMASLIASVTFLAMSPGDCPGATSAYLIAGSAAAVVAGEIMSASKYKSAVKKAEEKFKKVTSSTSTSSSSDNATATSAQAEAFQAMIEMEEATISAAKTKNMLYMVATAGYAAALVMTGIEIFTASNPVTGPAAQAALICKGATVSVTAAPTAQEHRTVADAYVDNYFQKNQRVSFRSYMNFSAIEGSQNDVELALANRELIELRSGAGRSDLDLQDYESIKFHTPKFTKQESYENFSLMRAATIIAQQFAMPSAHAVDPVATPLVITKVGTTAATTAQASGSVMQLASAGGTFTQGSATYTVQAAGPIKRLFLSPYTRLALAGVMTVNNIFMIKKTNEEKKKAEERKSFIEKLKAQVEAAGTEFGCANNDRNDLAKPNCYCYSESGGLNPARVNSATCKSLFGSRPALAGKASNPTAVSNQRNCVARNGALDSSCSCRTTNTCVSVSTPRVIGNVPSGNVLGTLPATINGLNNGSLSAADIDGAQFGNLAARLNNMNDKLVNDPKNKALALETRKAKALADKTMKDAQRTLAGAGPVLAASANSGSGLLGASSPSAALDEMKKELTQQIKGYEGNSVPVSSGTGGKKADDFNLDALSGNGGVTVSDQQLADAVNSMDMTAAEINSDSNANIFNILSNRYQRSGMRRLFGGEAMIEADKPTGTEINQ